MNVFVQFADSTEEVIISYFGSPQDATAWPNQGEVATSDARWATFYKSLPVAATEGLPVPG
jgi:hypothetical protein